MTNVRFRIYKDKRPNKYENNFRKRTGIVPLKVKSHQFTNIQRKKETLKDKERQQLKSKRAAFSITENELKELPGTVTPPTPLITPDSTMRDSDVQYTSTPNKYKFSKIVCNVSKINRLLGESTAPILQKHVSFKPQRNYEMIPLKYDLKKRQKWMKICFLKAKKTAHKNKRKFPVILIIDFHRDGDLIG